MSKSKCDLNCPKCHKKWGVMAFVYGSYVQATDVKVVAGKRKKFKNGEDLTCTCCGYTYTNWDVLLAVAESGRENGKAQIP